MKKVIGSVLGVLAIIGYIIYRFHIGLDGHGDFRENVVLAAAIILSVAAYILLRDPEKSITLDEAAAELSVCREAEGPNFLQVVATIRGVTMNGSGPVISLGTDGWGRTVVSLRKRLTILELGETDCVEVGAELSCREGEEPTNLKVGDSVEFSGTLREVEVKDGVLLFTVVSCRLIP